MQVVIRTHSVQLLSEHHSRGGRQITLGWNYTGKTLFSSWLTEKTQTKIRYPDRHGILDKWLNRCYFFVLLTSFQNCGIGVAIPQCQYHVVQQAFNIFLKPLGMADTSGAWKSVVIMSTFCHCLCSSRHKDKFQALQSKTSVSTERESWGLGPHAKARGGHPWGWL